MGSLLVFSGVDAQAAPVPSPLVPVVPAIAGNAKVGKTLTAKTGTWQPAPVTLAYQWYRSGAAITGAIQPSYLLVAADKGKTITVAVTGTKEGYATAFRTSKPTVKVVPGTLSAATPTITGYPKVEKTLTAVPGTWGPAPVTLKYQWYRSGKAIAKATDSTYTLVAADSGKQITVKVTGWKAGYDTAVKTSKKTKKVTAGSLVAAVPTIKGEAVVGKTLTVTRGMWKPSGLKFSYQWYRSGKKISKAKKSTYKLVTSDKGKKITVKVTGSKKGYATTSKTSAPTVGVVLAMTSRTPTITGYRLISGTLTAQPGNWKPSRISFSYRWYADGVAIAGATTREIRVTPALIGKHITVSVTGKKSGYATSTRTSAPTSAISPDGVYVVGLDIRAGTYLAKGGPYCNWWRLSSLDVDITTANRDTPQVMGKNVPTNGQTIATIAAERYFVSSGCGRWSTMSTTPSLRNSFGDGDWAVGIHIRPGIWHSTTLQGQECYVEAASGFQGSYAEITRWGEGEPGETSADVEVLAGDTRFTSSGCGTWVYQGASPAPTTVLTRGSRTDAASGATTKAASKLMNRAARLVTSVPSLEVAR